MRIAIPTFGTRVSPRFDSAPSLLLISTDGGAIQNRTVESMQDVYGHQRISLLSEAGADVLLCGGIRRCDYFSILNAGIDVYAGLMGRVEDILDAFLNGALPKGGVSGSPIAVGPRRRRQRAGGRGRGYTAQEGSSRRSG
jgi:predicted Fe-Mo cluster-binding NifX family protein